MSSSLLLMEPMGGSFGEFLLACRTAWCGRVFRTTGVTRGSGCVSQVVGAGGLVFLSPCEPRLVRIVSDSWGLLSRCLFDERRVESELSSWRAWCMGVGRSYGRILHISGMTPAVPGYIDFGSGLEFAPWPLER